MNTTRNGKAKVVLQATQIEKKSLDTALVTVPVGYQQLDMGKMMRQQKPKEPGN